MKNWKTVKIIHYTKHQSLVTHTDKPSEGGNMYPNCDKPDNLQKNMTEEATIQKFAFWIAILTLQ